MHVCTPVTPTDVFVIDGHKDVDGSLHPQQPQAEGHQQLQEDVAAGPHVRYEQQDFPPEALPGGLVLLGAAQKALSWERERETLGGLRKGRETFWLAAETLKRYLSAVLHIPLVFVDQQHVRPAGQTRRPEAEEEEQPGGRVAIQPKAKLHLTARETPS